MDTGKSSGYNLFSYCLNNPVNLSDPTGHWPNIIKSVKRIIVKAINFIKNNFIPSIRYTVPLYNQGDRNLCWAYSQTMIEDYREGRSRTSTEADARAKEIAVSVYGTEDWNQGGWPTNASQPFSQRGQEPPSILSLKLLLICNGPMYAYYGGESGAHLVVVTGVNSKSGIVYTNNPWGISGEQTYNQFIQGFAGMPDDWDMPFGFLIFAQ